MSDFGTSPHGKQLSYSCLYAKLLLNELPQGKIRKFAMRYDGSEKKSDNNSLFVVFLV
jgi:hypothetical protein